MSFLHQPECIKVRASCLDLDSQGSGWPRARWHVWHCASLEAFSCVQIGVLYTSCRVGYAKGMGNDLHVFTLTCMQVSAAATNVQSSLSDSPGDQE